MTTTAPEAVEELRARTGRFFLVWAVALAAAIFLQIAGASVTPLTSLWAAEGAPPVTAPADPGAPVEPGVTEPGPSTPTAADVCATGTDPFTKRICAATSSLGWTVTAVTPELAAGVDFTAVDESGLPPLAVGGRFEVTNLVERSTLVFSHSHDGLTRAEVVALPAQVDASLANDIRAALASEVWFFDGDFIADAPNPLSFGDGWSVATMHDPSRSVGQVVTVGWVILTVTISEPNVGTIYAVTVS